jgi:hypothetical protein
MHNELEHERDKLLPATLGLESLLVPGLHLVELAQTGFKVDLGEGHDLCLLDDLPAKVAEEKDRQADVGGDESARVPVALKKDGKAVEERNDGEPKDLVSGCRGIDSLRSMRATAAAARDRGRCRD